MARRATGTVEWQEATSASPGHWKARIRLADGTRPWIHYDELQRPEDEREAFLARMTARQPPSIWKLMKVSKTMIMMAGAASSGVGQPAASNSRILPASTK